MLRHISLNLEEGPDTNKKLPNTRVLKTIMLPNSFPYHFGKRGFHDLEQEHDLITERLRKTLYYGKNPNTDRPSLPLTEIAVEFFNEAAPRQLGKLDTYMASSSSRQTCMSPCSMMMGMLYIKRLRRHNMDYLQQISSSDLFLISVMMASKFIYDEEKRIAFGQGLDRGWFSYTDMIILNDHLNCLTIWNKFGREVMQILAASIVTYLAGLLVMVGSTVMVTYMSTALVSVRLISSPSLPRLVDTPVSLSSQQEFNTIYHREDLPTINECNNTGTEQELPGRLDRSSTGEVPDANSNEQTIVSNVLSQLLAVVTLKDSYLEFLRAVRDRYMFSAGETFSKRRGKKEEILCAEGPCLQNARKSCKNVTNCVTLSSSHCRECLNKRQSGNDGTGTSTGCFRKYPSGPHLTESAFSGIGFGVRCCCSTGNYDSQQDLLNQGSLLLAFSDISLGFMTGPYHTAILGNT
ncbi:hypothetical protein KUTeg_002651 [Tegillarca granosa]|uniref:Protein CNPPD1 n=1 Tax=Tegillarca granosa TaxID=220873 RepID=A0ABQ9FUX4_TEGGR|nr:hypothetical protein KUTeg_002651 [Tegillarca granosa]